jgi:antitoxin component of MazEF toxin-antitoxin module
MKAKVINIGNSRGVRIPKPLLEESGLGTEVELEVRKGEIRIRSAPLKKPKVPITALLSETSFAKDWLRPEEEKAWQGYQLAK